MTAHQLAAKLLTLPDLPVVINDWHMSELAHEVTGTSQQYGMGFQHEDKSLVDDLGYGLPANCIKLEHCD